jgi:hypothetical protein
MIYAEDKSECMGRQTVTTKVNGETRRFIVESAESAGLTTAEFLRRIIEVYRSSLTGEVECHNCDASVNLSPGVER